MSYQNLLLSENNGIYTLTINREKALNALNTDTLLELKHFFGTYLPALDHAKGVILTGAGEKAFVAGADIKEFLALDQHKGREMAQRGQDIFFLIEGAKVPVVALVNGFALGGGCELAMACHLRIATPNARFGQPEVKLGIIPGYGGTQRLIQYLGKTKAIELLLTGDMINAEQALQLGLLNYVLEPADALAKANELIEKVAAQGPIAIQKVIEVVNDYFKAGVDGFAKEVEAFGQTTGTEDFKEGAAAFIEKRTPQFKGE